MGGVSVGTKVIVLKWHLGPIQVNVGGKIKANLKVCQKQEQYQAWEMLWQRNLRDTTVGDQHGCHQILGPRSMTLIQATLVRQRLLR